MLVQEEALELILFVNAVGNRYEGREILWLNAHYVLVRLVDDSLRGAPAPLTG
jgi:hypothetical protein